MSEQNCTDIVEGRRNPVFAILGVVALVVAGWGLAGGPDITGGSAIPWTILVVGLLVGVGLVVSGIRRR